MSFWKVRDRISSIKSKKKRKEKVKNGEEGNIILQKKIWVEKNVNFLDKSNIKVMNISGNWTSYIAKQRYTFAIY